MTATGRLVRLDGTAAGQTLQLTRDFTTLGRHPSCDVGFDTAGDLDVSARHAAIFRDGDRWLIRDLESSNGTWVDGDRIRVDHPLSDGAVIRLGEQGPGLRFECTTVAGVELPPTRRSGPGHLTRGQRGLVAVAVALVALLAWGGWRTLEDRRAGSRREAGLLARVDSLAAALAEAERRESRLAGLVAEARAEAAQVGQSIRAGNGTSARLDSLDALVERLARRQAPLLRAVDFDLATATSGNLEAVALVLAERDDLSTVTGTGFVIQARGDTSWVVTSRHLLLDPAGAPARRLGLVFNGSAQNFQATPVRTHPTLDLGLLRVVVRGGTPVVRGVADAVEAGTPVATVTFPLGLELASSGDWRQTGVAASAFAATVTQVGPDRLQLDGYGVEGMSGSPLFDREGRVVGVIFGGVAESRGRIVLAVPAGRLRELLAGDEGR